MNTRWNTIYEENKKLDAIYDEKYGETFKQNTIELLVELGEFINETKCFKYWTIKKPIKEKVLDEFADCITMTLYFYNYLNLDLEVLEIKDKELLEIINETFNLSTKIMNNLNKELIINIFSNLLYIIKQLGYDEEEILDAIDKKEKIVMERLNSDY